MKLYIINGPNLNMLGIREPDHYGRETYADLVKKIENYCEAKGIEVELYQSNHEGDLVDKIQSAYNNIEYPKRFASCVLQKDFKGVKSETVRFLVNF